MTMPLQRSNGFSVVEMTVALATMLAVSAAAFRLMAPSQDHFASGTETADMQQRLRVAADMLSQHLIVAGVGAYVGPSAGALSNALAPIRPYRAGGAVQDPPGSFKSDTITLFSVARNATQPTSTTLWWKKDDTAATYQLMINESSNNIDVPIVDNLVGLAFEYYGDPQPPTIRQPADPSGPWQTTYGPAPAVTAVPPFAAGENCIFVAAATPAPQPRLADLGAAGTALVKLTAALLSDGPWCPTDTAGGAWDADLLRVRAVAVTLRVQAALSSLRGPASVLFAHGGSARGGYRWVPDQEMRFQVTPRNLNFGR